MNKELFGERVSGIPIFSLYFVLFPVLGTFWLQEVAHKKHLEHYIFVCLSILRIAERLAPGRYESLFSAQELDILVSSPGLSLIG